MTTIHTMTLPAPLSRPVTERTYELIEDYLAVIVVADRIWKFHAKKGYCWDGASIPRFAWTITGVYPMAAMIQAPSLIHDGMYGAELFPRIQCDRCFRNDMERNGYNRIARNIFYQAVRIGGRSVWKNHTSQGVADERKFVKVRPVVY